jgi:hypothetical protein
MAGNEKAACAGTGVLAQAAFGAEAPACPAAPASPSSDRGAAVLEIPASTIVPGAHPGGVMLFTRVGERQLGMRLLSGFYATVALQPNRALDPVPPNLSPTDRVLVGLSYVIKF